MNDAAVVGRLLDEYHERSVAPADITIVAGSEHQARVTYRLTQSDGSAHVIRAFRADEPIPVQGHGVPDQTLADWLLGRARTLAALETAGYPAPRPVRTRTGELVGVAGTWLSWATTYEPGSVLRPTLDQLRLLGATLARLHEVPASAGSAVGRAPRHPAVAGLATLARLDAVAGIVPPAWRLMHDTFRQTAEAVTSAAGSVPETLVHGDVWARNAVQAPGGAVTLIDWETSGLGLAVLDLGNCLLECHLDAGLPDNRPAAWLISADEHRLAAVAAGYASVRKLSPAELALLPDAVRFSAAVVGSIHFELALSAGVSGPTMDARLARLANRLDIAAAVAGLAHQHMDLST